MLLNLGLDAEMVTGVVLGKNAVDRNARNVTALRTDNVKAKIEFARVQMECILPLYTIEMQRLVNKCVGTHVKDIEAPFLLNAKRFLSKYKLAMNF
jgi:hypothetical protein